MFRNLYGQAHRALGVFLITMPLAIKHAEIAKLNNPEAECDDQTAHNNNNISFQRNTIWKLLTSIPLKPRQNGHQFSDNIFKLFSWIKIIVFDFIIIEGFHKK